MSETSEKKPIVSIISAIGRENRVIGKSTGEIPWHIREDFQHFKDTTMGHTMIMGSKTWETFDGKPLPGRTHIVLARDSDNYQLPEGVDNLILANSMEKAIEIADEIEREKNGDKGDGEIFIIGGGQIYNLGLPFADRLYLTFVSRKDGAPIEGDVFFPEYAEQFTKKISSRESSDENYEYEFAILEK